VWAVNNSSQVKQHPCWSVVACVFVAANPSITPRSTSCAELAAEKHEMFESHTFTGQPPPHALVIPESREQPTSA
jgi:hypothetical protein